MTTLRGASITVLGFGNIGGWIGRLAKPFGVRVTGVGRRVPDRPDWFDDDDRAVSVDGLDAALPTTAYLVAPLPGPPEPDRILDARRLALLPPHAVVVNVGRGNAIDEAALVDALRDGMIDAACLDVFEQEPLPADSPLRALPNAFLMPHASAVAPSYLDRFVDEFIAKWRGRYGEAE